MAEAEAVLRPAPPRSVGRSSGGAFDGALAFGERLHAAEADADFGMFAETQEAAAHGAVAAAPAAGGLVRRLEATGQAHVMRAGGEQLGVDEYRFFEGNTLRWRARSPSDPPFNNTPITYELTYSLSNILQKEGDHWLLDHNFGFADRPGVIENFTVRLLELTPTWQPMMAFNGTYSGRNLPPGENFVVHVPIRYAGAGDGPAYEPSGSSSSVRAFLRFRQLLMKARSSALT